MRRWHGWTPRARAGVVIIPIAMVALVFWNATVDRVPDTRSDSGVAPPTVPTASPADGIPDFTVLERPLPTKGYVLIVALFGKERELATNRTCYNAARLGYVLPESIVVDHTWHSSWERGNWRCR